MRTWAIAAGLNPPAQLIDRDRGEGPPRCCEVRLVAADALIWWGELPAGVIAAAKARLPRLVDVEEKDLYLCSGCGELLVREFLVTREELARGQGLSARRIAKAWIHDEEFWRRGPESAPPEVQVQPWWADYESLAAKQLSADPIAAVAARDSWKSEVLALLRRYGS